SFLHSADPENRSDRWNACILPVHSWLVLRCLRSLVPRTAGYSVGWHEFGSLTDRSRAIRPNIAVVRARSAAHGPHMDTAGTGTGGRAQQAERSRQSAAGRAQRASDQVGAVGQHDGLDAVAQVELAEHVGHVGLHGRLAEVQRRGDLRVGQPRAHELEHLALARGEQTEPRWQVGRSGSAAGAARTTTGARTSGPRTTGARAAAV